MFKAKKVRFLLKSSLYRELGERRVGEMERKSYEMLWDCSSCGEKGLLGKTHRRCPSCGAAQDERTRRFLEKGEEVEARAHVFAGRDWECSYCGTPSSAAAGFCPSCGAPRGSSESVALVEEPTRKPKAEVSVRDKGAAAAFYSEPKQKARSEAKRDVRYLAAGVLAFALAAA